MSRFDLDAWTRRRRAEVDAMLDERLPAVPRARDPGRLVEAMRYSLLAPGKRLRPLLTLAAAEALGARLDFPVRMAAGAIELVHCYSLIHDDLPAMDDDDLRRGRPTSHKVFGEATAILAGDALLALAFEWVSEGGLESEESERHRPRSAPAPERRPDFLRVSRALAGAAGKDGMVRGQARDLGEPPPSTMESLEELHAEKTGALFRAAIEMGAHAVGASEDELASLTAYAQLYGVAFQHADDLDDGEHGQFADDAQRRLTSLTEQAVESLSDFGPAADPLRALAMALGLDSAGRAGAGAAEAAEGGLDGQS